MLRVSLFLFDQKILSVLSSIYSIEKFFERFYFIFLSFFSLLSEIILIRKKTEHTCQCFRNSNRRSFRSNNFIRNRRVKFLIKGHIFINRFPNCSRNTKRDKTT